MHFAHFYHRFGDIGRSFFVGLLAVASGHASISQADKIVFRFDRLCRLFVLWSLLIGTPLTCRAEPPITRQSVKATDKVSNIVPSVLIAHTSKLEHVRISGETQQWHAVTLTLDGPQASETDVDSNPFLDYNFSVTVTHESGSPAYTVPGYFAADGNAGQTNANSGNQWRAHLSPDKTGVWNYQIHFQRGKQVAIGGTGTPIDTLDGIEGTFHVDPSDKSGQDLRAHGRLQYVGEHYLKFAGSQKYFLKVGADSPETLLAYSDFDGTASNKPNIA